MCQEQEERLGKPEEWQEGWESHVQSPLPAVLAGLLPKACGWVGGGGWLCSSKAAMLGAGIEL